MRTKDDQRRTMARIERAEAEADATIRRAFDRVLHKLQNELREYKIRAAKRKRHV